MTDATSRQPSHILVSGYAGIDYAWQADSSPQPGRTALLAGPATPRPRFGGCAPYVARELAAMGCQVALISWLGDDDVGGEYRALLERAGIDLGGVAIARGQPSPRSFLFYDPDGRATCCYHPSGSRSLRLDSAGHSLLSDSRALALTVGPAPLTQDLLDARPPHTLLAWSVKADPDAYPPGLRRRLLAEADLVCLNREEVGFLAEAFDEQASGSRGEDELKLVTGASRGTVVVTAGKAGVTVAWPGGREVVQPERVEVDDPTGAGDAFFSAFLAATLDGALPVVAARTAIEHVTRLLQRAAGQEAAS